MFVVVGNALKYLGYSYNSDNEKELMEVRDLLMKQKSRVMAYDSWPQTACAGAGSLAVQLLVLGIRISTIRNWIPSEVVCLRKEPNSRRRSPLVIPKGAPHPAAAHLFINYVMSPEVNTQLILGIGYTPQS